MMGIHVESVQLEEDALLLHHEHTAAKHEHRIQRAHVERGEVTALEHGLHQHGQYESVASTRAPCIRRRAPSASISMRTL